MKIRILLFLSVFLIGEKVFGQSLNEEQFDQLIRSAFTNIVSPNNSSNLGNYAALDTKESEMSFAGAIVPKFSKRPFLIGIKFNGGGSNGILPIFNDNQFATKVGGELQFNVLTNRRKEFIIYDVELEETQKKALLKNEQEYQKRLIEIKLNKDSLNLKDSILRKEKQVYDLSNELKDLEKKLEEIKKKLPGVTNSRKKDSLVYKLREFELTIPLKQVDIKICENDLGHLKKSFDELRPKWELEFEALNTKLSADIKAKENLKVTGFQVQWFSIIAGFSNKTFRLFDSAVLVVDQPLKDQFGKSNFVTPNIGLSYSWYKKDKRIQYWNLTAVYRNKDNSSSLTELMIKDKINYPTNTASRTSESELKVLDNSEDSYIKDKLNIELSIDFYRFMFQDYGAIHLNLTHNINDGVLPFTNATAGMFFSFKKMNDKSGSLVNAELYFTFKDIFDIQELEGNLFERSGIGFRTTFPIVF